MPECQMPALAVLDADAPPPLSITHASKGFVILAKFPKVLKSVPGVIKAPTFARICANSSAVLPVHKKEVQYNSSAVLTVYKMVKSSVALRSVQKSVKSCSVVHVQSLQMCCTVLDPTPLYSTPLHCTVLYISVL
jgi:hypothetical protein